MLSPVPHTTKHPRPQPAPTRSVPFHCHQLRPHCAQPNNGARTFHQGDPINWHCRTTSVTILGVPRPPHPNPPHPIQPAATRHAPHRIHVRRGRRRPDRPGPYPSPDENFVHHRCPSPSSLASGVPLPPQGEPHQAARRRAAVAPPPRPRHLRPALLNPSPSLHPPPTAVLRPPPGVLHAPLSLRLTSNSPRTRSWSTSSATARATTTRRRPTGTPRASRASRTGPSTTRTGGTKTPSSRGRAWRRRGPCGRGRRRSRRSSSS